MSFASMKRRDLLKLAAGLPLLSPAWALAAPRTKIKQVRIRKLRIAKEHGTYSDWVGGTRFARTGGGTVTEILTDQGAVGIGPGVPEDMLARISAMLVGQDPFDIQVLAPKIMSLPRSGYGGPAGADIALWDLIGKLTGQPLYKLWGGGRDKVPAYSSMLSLGTPEERADKALQVKQAGWTAIKFRSSFPTFRDDVRLVELTKKACGDDFVIMTDANKAGFTMSGTGGGPGVPWDFTRAAKTADAYQALDVYWLEEPLPRYEYEMIAELNRMFYMKIVGGESNSTVKEFRWYLEKGCYDVVQPEVNLEGPSRLRTIATLAEAVGKQCIPHVGDMRFGTICDLHLVASWSNAPYIEIFNEIPVGGYMNAGFAVFENPPVLDKQGNLPVPQGPGLGVTIPADLFEKA